MAIVINGSGTITGISAGGLPDGTVTADDLASTLDLSGKTVTLPSGTGGKVLQVVQGTYSTQTTTTSATFIDTGLAASITPSSSSNKILVLVNQGKCYVDASTQIGLKLFRGATEILVYRYILDTNDATRQNEVVSFSYLDSPSTTSSVTYKTQFNDEQTGVGTGVQYGNSPASIVLMEIAA